MCRPTERLGLMASVVINRCFMVLCLAGLSSIVTGITTDVCNRVRVSATLYELEAAGDYVLSTQQCNEKPVWAQETGDFYLYYLLDGFDGWIIRTSTCLSWGGPVLLAKTDSNQPYNLTGVWREYDKNGTFVENQQLQVQCVKFGGVPMSACVATLCKNGGTCVDHVAYYTCSCTSKYTGKQCEVHINDAHDMNTAYQSDTHEVLLLTGSAILLIMAAVLLAVCICVKHHRNKRAQMEAGRIFHTGDIYGPTTIKYSHLVDAAPTQQPHRTTIETEKFMEDVS